MRKVNEFFQKEATMWGPIFLLMSIALSVKTAIPFDFLICAILGLYLAARHHVRGCLYALVFLAIGAICKHAFFPTDHLWQLGLEASLGISFFLTALAFEEKSSSTQSLHAQIETGKLAVKNLEEEFAKTREEVLIGQIATQDKIDRLQKEFEDLQGDHSSILILNEVLRKTTARSNHEKELQTSLQADLRRENGWLKTELIQVQQELKRVTSTETLALENHQLMKELNAARVGKEQIHLINETLARLYMRENLKAKEADVEAGATAEQLAHVRREVERLRKSLETANAQPKLDPELQEELDFAREKMVHLSQTEPVLKQLRKQFEERNQTLHQARSELFKVDTELQRLKMEQAARELNPLPQELEMEFQKMGEQVCTLEEENQQLHELIAVLMESESESASRKKKLKTKSPKTAEQDLLF